MIRMKAVVLAGMCAVCLTCGCQEEKGYSGTVPHFDYTIEPSLMEAQDVLVGVNYYAGWWPSLPEMPNKWHDFKDGHNWLEDYPERTPLLGLYNDQETMDKEIVAAAGHGVDFFLILWYPWDNLDTTWYQSPKLNDGLTYFVQSPEAHRMKFCIEVCNHPPFAIRDMAFWNACIDVWIEAMRHPSYLKVDGRRVIKIHTMGQLASDCGGDLERVGQWLEILRSRAREAGLGELVICGGAPGPMVWEGHWAPRYFDFTGDYMDVPTFFPGHLGKPYPYDWLSVFMVRMRAGHQFDAAPYLPVLGSSWDPRPWDYPEDTRPPYVFPSREEWTRDLERMAHDLNTMQPLGIPRRDGSVQKAFTIYAWNEFGEGSMVAPTEGQGYMMLECIREVFGVKEHTKSIQTVQE